jgi:hypothetical protein
MLCVAVAAIGCAQPLFESTQSIELRSAQATAIFRATVEKYDRGTMTLKIIEVIKGKVPKTLQIETETRWGQKLRSQWAEARTEFLWFAGVTENSNLSGRHPKLGFLNTIRLGGPVPEEGGFKHDKPIISMDMSVLRENAKILERVRKWATHPGGVRSIGIRYATARDGGTTTLLVPACRNEMCCRKLESDKS